MSEHVVIIDEKNFEAEVIKSKIPVLVDFWAEWCGPCQTFAPIIEEIAIMYEGKAKFAKVNVDKNPSLTNTYGVRGIPTLILFKAGKSVVTKVGVLSKAQLEALIQANI